jgi:hypothetical protein
MTNQSRKVCINGNIIFVSIDGYQPNMIIDTNTGIWYKYDRSNLPRKKLVKENYILKKFNNKSYYIGEITLKIFIETQLGKEQQNKLQINNIKPTKNKYEISIIGLNLFNDCINN